MAVGAESRNAIESRKYQCFENEVVGEERLMDGMERGGNRGGIERERGQRERESKKGSGIRRVRRAIRGPLEDGKPEVSLADG